MNRNKKLIMLYCFIIMLTLAATNFSIKNNYSEAIYVAWANDDQPTEIQSVLYQPVKHIEPGKVIIATINRKKPVQILITPYFPIPGNTVFVYNIPADQTEKTAINMHVNVIKNESLTFGVQKAPSKVISGLPDIKSESESKVIQTFNVASLGVYQPQITLPTSWFYQNISNKDLKLQELLYPESLQRNAYKILADIQGIDSLSEASSPRAILGLKNFKLPDIPHSIVKKIFERKGYIVEKKRGAYTFTRFTKEETIPSEQLQKTYSQMIEKMIKDNPEWAREYERLNRTYQALRGVVYNTYGRSDNKYFKNLFKEMFKIIEHAYLDLGGQLSEVDEQIKRADEYTWTESPAYETP